MQLYRIGIDIDDVLISTAKCVLSLYNSKYGTNIINVDAYNLSDLSIWNAETPHEVNRRIAEILKSDDFKYVQPLADSLRVLQKWQKNGYILYIITGRPKSMQSETIGLIDQLFPDIFKQDHFYFTDHYNHDSDVRSSKGDIVSDLQLTHYIDDQAEHVNDVARDGLCTILFDDNYERDQPDLAQGIVKLSSWKQIEQYIDAEQKVSR